MLHVQATIVKIQLSKIARAPRLEGFGCHGTSRSEPSSLEAESPAAAKNAKNKYNTNSFRAEEPDPDIWKMPCAILARLNDRCAQETCVLAVERETCGVVKIF